MEFIGTIVKESVELKESKISEIPNFFDELDYNSEYKDSVVGNEGVDDKTPIYIITRNEDLEGDFHPITEVPFDKKVVELSNGEVIEGVFPEFESVFEAKVNEGMYEESDYKQFKECNEQLLDKLENNADLRDMFSNEQIDQIKDGVQDGTSPDGYVWHHSYEPGKIQLVDFETHSRTGHTGGRSVWGGGSESR